MAFHLPGFNPLGHLGLGRRRRSRRGAPKINTPVALGYLAFIAGFVVWWVFLSS